jgi:hypothetical protein
VLARYLTQSVERLFTARGGMGISEPAPLQKAITRIIDDKPLGELAGEETVAKALGGAEVTRRPDELVVFSGVRAGKTSIVAAAAICLSQTVDTSMLMRGEAFRIPIVSLSKDLAGQAYAHLKNALTLSPQLAGLLLEEPDAERLVVRTPSGHPCEIMVTAGSRAGASVSARWLGGAIFDEFPKMLGAEEGVINWDHMRGECTGRILPKGMMFHIGSPWAPFGPAYEKFVEYFGRPADGMLVLKAPGYWMNPKWWTPERCADFRAKHPDIAVTNLDADFADQEDNLLDQASLEACRTIAGDLEPDPNASYSAAMDPATRRNAWTLVISTRLGNKIVDACVREWIGTPKEPLSPREVWKELGPLLRRYRITLARTDQYYSDAMRDHASDYGITLLVDGVQGEEETKRYLFLRDRIADGTMALSTEPHYRTDLQRIRRRTTQAGMRAHLPKTSDGRHCDFAAAKVLSLVPYLPDVKQPPPGFETSEWFKREAERMKREARNEMRRRRAA